LEVQKEKLWMQEEKPKPYCFSVRNGEEKTTFITRFKVLNKTS